MHDCLTLTGLIQRILSEQLGVSLGTVTKALNSAASRGLVRSETGRGTFVHGSSTQAFGKIHEYDSVVVDLSRTWPLNALDPDLSPVLRSVAKSADRGPLLHYQDNLGMLRHREAGANWARRFGIEPEPDCIAVCNGVQHAITVVLSFLTSPGDCVLTEELTYPGFKAASQFLNLRVAGLTIDSEGIIPSSFEAACKQKKAKVLYCIPTHHSPTTGTMSTERRQAIASMGHRNTRNGSAAAAANSQ